jgi:fructuronate reductase
VDALLRDEVEPTLAGVELDGYRARLLERFANPALAHRCAQIAMDGSQKMPQRILDTIRDRLQAGQAIDRLALTVACWWWHQRAPGADDPLAAELHAHWLRSTGRADPAHRADAHAHAQAQALTQFQPVFGDLAGAPALVAALAPHLRSLAERGPLATLETMP